MPEITEYLQSLSSAAPTPGGGSVAALQVALGASLLAMVANLTIGKPRYAAVQELMERARDLAIATRDEAWGMSAADERAFAVVAVAMALPRDSEAERATRQRELQAALAAAVEPPLQTMRLAVRVVQLARELVGTANRHAVSDVGTAVLCAAAGYDAASLNVAINSAAIREATVRETIARQVLQIPDPRGDAMAIVARTRALIRGEE